MKFVWLVLFWTLNVNAAEVLVGGTTVHFTGAYQEYSNKITGGGEIILTPMIAFRDQINHKTAFAEYSVFGGLNSIGEPMAGLAGSLGFAGVRGHQVGAVHGFYVQNNRKFRNLGIEPFSAMEFHGTGIVPVIGIQHTRIYDNGFLINTLLTPAIGNVSIGWRF